MEFLGNWIRNIVLVIMLNTFLEIMMPSSKLRSYVRVIMGFFLIIVLLQPLGELLELPGHGLTLGTQELLTREILAEGEKMEDKNRELVLRNYGIALAQQVESIVCMHPEIERAYAQVFLTAEGELERIWVRVHTEEISKGQIQIDPILLSRRQDEDEEWKEAMVREIQVMLKNFFGLDLHYIQVEVVE